MTAAIWSTPPDTCATDFPARTLVCYPIFFKGSEPNVIWLDSIYAQPPLASTDWKAIVVNYQGRQVSIMLDHVLCRSHHGQSTAEFTSTELYLGYPSHSCTCPRQCMQSKLPQNHDHQS
jgi:hypothetical protein